MTHIPEARITLIACTRCSWLTTDIGHRCEQQLPLGDMLALPCPSCGTASWYSCGLDCYVHASIHLPHGPCWLRAVQGNIDWDIEMDNERAIARHSRRRTSAA